MTKAEGSLSRGNVKESRTTILLADDHPVFRKGLRIVLSKHAGWEIAGEAANGLEAVEKARQLKPDVVILDISMPELGGLEASRMIVKALPEVRVIISSAHSEDEYIARAAQSGARGYVVKSEAERDLVRAVESVLEGRSFFPAGFDGAGRAITMGLSPRELEVLTLLAQGRSNKQVAAELGMSTRTAENHRAAIMKKMKFDSFSALIRYAVRKRMVEL